MDCRSRHIYAGVRRTAVAALIGAWAVGIAGCSTHADATPPQTVTVRVADLSIIGPSHIAAGTTRFVIPNAGPTVHELVLARTLYSAAELPIASDGTSADETSIQVIASDEHLVLDQEGGFTTTLTAGHYVLVCNLPGHYMGGMHADLYVDAPRTTTPTTGTTTR